MARNKYPEQTVNRILDVALDLFMKKGYDNTSIQDIIGGLGGLSKGAVYYHFKSKEEILSAALDRESIPLLKNLKSVLSDNAMNGGQKLQALLEASLAGPQMNMWSDIAPEFDATNNARLMSMEYEALFKETVPQFVQPIVEQGVADGSIKTDYPREFSEIIVLIANFWVSPMFCFCTAEDMRRRVNYYLDIVKVLGGVELTDNGLSNLLETHRERYSQRLEKLREEGREDG